MTASATTQLPTRDHLLARLSHAVQQERVVILLAFAAVGAPRRRRQLPPARAGHVGGRPAGRRPRAARARGGRRLVYPRVRAGARAALALSSASSASLVGTEAVYYTLAAPRPATTSPGFLSLVAGFLLLGSRNRDPLADHGATDDRLCRRYLRRAPARRRRTRPAIALVLFPTALAYVVTHTLRADVPEARTSARRHEDVSFKTSDGLRLEGWFVPSRNGATVIVVPGRSGPQKQTRMLVRHGYGVLLFDRRGEGASDGDPNVFGWVGDRDLHAATAYLRSRPDVDPERIGAIGLSVGGEMLIHAAAHSDAFKAIVSEGGSGQSFRDGYANHGLRAAILGDGAVTLATAIFTSTLPPPSLKSEVAKIAPTAVFFVYGRRARAARRRSRTRASTRPPASRSRSGKCRTGSTSPASPPSRRSTSAA